MATSSEASDANVKSQWLLELQDRAEKVPRLLRQTFILLTLGFIIIGMICLLVPNTTTTTYEIPNSTVLDYTNCYNREKEDSKQTCIETLSNPNVSSCSCIVSFNLNKDIEGDILLYHELDYNNFNFTKSSRDYQQLKGMLSDKLSLDCNPFDYVNTSDGIKPIAPCGALADAMFNDSYFLSNPSDVNYAPTTTQGIISEDNKVGFHNPPLSDGMTLQQAFQNFTKPINWRKNIWELNRNNTSNNGFEYEPFISWMNQDWTSKPVWRLDNSTQGYEKGLKAGDYGLIIFYNYPLSRYNGTRKVILGNRFIRTDVIVTNNTATVIGAIFVTVGLILLLATAFIMYVNHSKAKSLERPDPEYSPMTGRRRPTT